MTKWQQVPKGLRQRAEDIGETLDVDDRCSPIVLGKSGKLERVQDHGRTVYVEQRIIGGMIVYLPL